VQPGGSADLTYSGQQRRRLERALDHRDVENVAGTGALDHRALRRPGRSQRRPGNDGETVAEAIDVEVVDVAIVVHVAALTGIADAVGDRGEDAGRVFLPRVEGEAAVVAVRGDEVGVGVERRKSAGDDGPEAWSDADERE
jgi:hypothetical protein